MNFDLGPDELALQEALRGRWPLERVRKGFDAELWSELHDAGVFSLHEIGYGLAQAVVVFEELGRQLVPGPLVGTYIARGARRTVGVADRGLVELLPELDGVLTAKGVVDPPHGEAVERPLDPLTPLYRTEGDVGFHPEGAALAAALLVGIAQATTDMAVAYARERVQFGRPIGSFQAVKHLCADMLVRTEVARAAAYAAGVEPDDRAVRTAKLLASEHAVANGKACIQIHGGMGFTWEVPAHLYLKRAAVLATRFGTPDEHAGALAR